MNKFLIGLILILVTFNGKLFSQTSNDLKNEITVDSLKSVKDTSTHDRDVIDIFHSLIKKENHPHLYKPKTKTGRTQFAVIPAVGYSLETGFAILVAANAVFYTDESRQSKASNILGSGAYTQYGQIILPFQANIWTKGNKYNIISDSRYMNYPSVTFGLGVKSNITNGYDIDFSYLKLHQSILKNLSNNFFAGLGYYYDYLWNEREINPPADSKTSFQKYGLHSSETASGICFQGLFDNRENQVNPQGGMYGNVRYRSNSTWLGSSSNWQSGILELKKYFKFPKNSHNILAFWNYNWITLNGKPPYLLLPSTGWDDFFNTGRGYVQGRYRAKNMSYLETEYRFRILKNGLLGGVVFANVQTFSKDFSSQYQTLLPAGGFGLRIKMNKHSSTNLCIDYGFGMQGSRGFFVNLGEVF